MTEAKLKITMFKHKWPFTDSEIKTIEITVTDGLMFQPPDGYIITGIELSEDK
jgi:hypothetical protein